MRTEKGGGCSLWLDMVSTTRNTGVTCFMVLNVNEEQGMGLLSHLHGYLSAALENVAGEYPSRELQRPDCVAIKKVSKKQAFLL